MNGADGRPIATTLAPIARQSDHRRTGPPETERHRSHRARPLAPLRSAKPWSGDRLSWLAEVERELARMGCSYRRASPFESFDLEVSLVGLAVCRVTTAVVWSWLPRFRVIVRPGRLMLPVAAAGALVGLAGRLLGTAVLAMAAAAAAVEAVLLWHLVRQVVGQTSRGTR